MKKKADDFIYNQRKIPKGKWRYGFRSSAATGCGWIAVYNALLLMGHRVKPEKLIRYFQWQIPLINGNFGTFLLSPIIYLRQRGLHVNLTIRKRKFDEAVRKSDVGILFYYWRRKFRFGAHFVTVRYCDGRFIGYNTFRNSEGPDNLGTSLESFLKKRKNFGCVLIAVKENKHDH